MRLVLEIRSGSNAGQKIAIQQGQFARVGRKSHADFAFPGNTGMSGLHFSIECTGDSCWVRDLNSTNGTWVNGQRVSEAALIDGDEIAAGEATFTVRIERDDPFSAAITEIPSFSVPSHPIFDSPLAPLGESPVGEGTPSVTSQVRGSPDSAIVSNYAGHHP